MLPNPDISFLSWLLQSYISKVNWRR